MKEREERKKTYLDRERGFFSYEEEIDIKLQVGWNGRGGGGYL